MLFSGRRQVPSIPNIKQEKPDVPEDDADKANNDQDGDDDISDDYEEGATAALNPVDEAEQADAIVNELTMSLQIKLEKTDINERLTAIN